ncbi:MAG: hypothetical protein ACYTET_04580 [Planctomycetota bacterium]|jgi:predicted nucleotidyltransferase
MCAASKKDWVDVETWCRKYFAFLMEEFNYNVQKTEYDTCFFSMILTNETTGLHLLFEVRDQRFFVSFCVLENGEYCMNPIIKSQDDIKQFDFDELLELRVPGQLWPKIKGILKWKGYEMTTAPFEDQISHKAKMLRLHGKDLLTGDFSFLKEHKKIVMARIRKDREIYG